MRSSPSQGSSKLQCTGRTCPGRNEAATQCERGTLCTTWDPSPEVTKKHVAQRLPLNALLRFSRGGIRKSKKEELLPPTKFAPFLLAPPPVPKELSPPEPPEAVSGATSEQQPGRTATPRSRQVQGHPARCGLAVSRKSGKQNHAGSAMATSREARELCLRLAEEASGHRRRLRAGSKSPITLGAASLQDGLAQRNPAQSAGSWIEAEVAKLQEKRFFRWKLDSVDMLPASSF